jgi:hypothetical protein
MTLRDGACKALFLDVRDMLGVPLYELWILHVIPYGRPKQATSIVAEKHKVEDTRDNNSFSRHSGASPGMVTKEWHPTRLQALAITEID